MSEIYHAAYYEQYHFANEIVNYTESERIRNFFDQAAQRIMEDLHPKTVLDAGCAAGYLVAALRDRGVDAYGIDISEYAISQVRQDVRPYCAVSSLTAPLPEGFPQKFDLVVSLSVLEHLTPNAGQKAVSNLCACTDQILFFSAPPYCCQDPVQVNSQPREYWTKLFAQAGFGDDFSYRPSYLSAYASYFQRGVVTPHEPAPAKPQHIRLDAVKSAAKSSRFIVQVYRVLKRLARCILLVGSAFKSLFRYGFSVTWQKAKKFFYNNLKASTTRATLYTRKELEQQKTVIFPKTVKFSILVPLYNTPSHFLRAMIQSVLDQTYGNWELCLADGSDGEHSEVGEICLEYAKQDDRIHYQKLEKNFGISGNTNACIDMATGDYISLFDHDDLLHPAALYATMKAICEQDADFIYTDENTFHDTPSDAFYPHYKPDYAPDTLRANNYICHFTTFKRSLLDTVGKFRPECDGSQDFDMVLRLTEQAKKIVHIPQILYYWRAHANSVAQNVDAKPYMVEAAKRAIGDHLKRVGLKGEVLDSAVPSMYRLRYEVEGEPLVSIIIPNYEHKSELKVCLDSIYEKTTYKNFEVIVVENNSSSQDIFQYYEEIQKKWSNLKIVVWSSHFNYSAINNYGSKFASGQHLLLLNNDTEVISPDWIQEMLMYSQRNDVGAVGAKLYFPDDTVQHGGVGLGLLSLAGHLHRNFPRNLPGYMGRLSYAQNLSAVTGACMMIRRDVWDSVGGLDESFEVEFNDVDICMRIRKAGYLIVWTPFAELYHYESKSRRLDNTPEKEARHFSEVERFQTRWAAELAAGDPYYNPNLSTKTEDFTIKRPSRLNNIFIK